MSTQNTSGGIGVLSLLGVMFVAFKLLGVIDWSWWWVTAPFWGPAALAITIMSTIWLIALIAALVSAR